MQAVVTNKPRCRCVSWKRKLLLKSLKSKRVFWRYMAEVDELAESRVGSAAYNTARLLHTRAHTHRNSATESRKEELEQLLRWTDNLIALPSAACADAMVLRVAAFAFCSSPMKTRSMVTTN
jgi:hypothetical protein